LSAGVYGALYEYEDYFTLMGNATLGFQHTHANRTIEFAQLYPESYFKSYILRDGMEADFRLVQKEEMQVDPFIELQASYIMNDKVQEKNGGAANLEIPASQYTKVSANYGIKAAAQKGKFNLAARLYAGSVLSERQITIQFRSVPEVGGMDIISNKLDAIFLGANIAIGYVLWDRVEVFTNIDVKQSENYLQYFSQIGVKIGFGEKVPPPYIRQISPISQYESKQGTQEIKKEENPDDYAIAQAQTETEQIPEPQAQVQTDHPELQVQVQADIIPEPQVQTQADPTPELQVQIESDPTTLTPQAKTKSAPVEIEIPADINIDIEVNIDPETISKTIADIQNDYRS